MRAVDESEFWSLVAECREKNMFYMQAKEKIASETGASEKTVRSYFTKHKLFQETKGFHKPKKYAIDEYPYRFNKAEKDFIDAVEGVKCLDSYGADFLYDSSIVEVKTKLNQSNFYKAYTQLNYANKLLKDEYSKKIVCKKFSVPESEVASILRMIKVLDVDLYTIEDSELVLVTSRKVISK